MSAEQGSKTTQPQAADKPQGAQIQDLMQAAKAAPQKPDLESEALRAAEVALAAGERALVQAREARGLPAVRPRHLRERVLRAVLVVNLLLMVVVLALPERTAATPAAGPVAPAPATEPAPAPTVPVHSGDLYDQALRAAAENDYSEACALLERWLEQNPRMNPSQQCNAFHALSWYWLKLGNLQKSQDYDQKAAALVRSSTLPEDLVAEAQQAEQRGDDEGLRRLWARFLLQQRQVPASLYGHVAEAYLKLGDSWRTEAGKAAEAARVRELEELRARMQREAAAEPPGKHE